MRKLTDRPEDWSKDIQTAFYEEFPFFVQYPISVNLVRKNVKKGFAVGNIVVTDTFAIPVIIDNYILKDFDVAMLEGRAVPLTPESIIDIFSNPSAFQLAGEKMQDSKLTRLFSPDLTYPADYGDNNRSGYRYTKTAALQKMLPYIKEENQQKLASIYTPQDVASFKKNGTLHLLEDFMKAEPLDKLDFQKIAADNLSQDYTFLYKVGRDKYHAYFMNSEVDHIEKMTLNEEEYQTQKMQLAAPVEKVASKDPKLVMNKCDAMPGSDGLITDGENHIKIAVTNVLTSDGNTTIEGLGKHLKHLSLDVSHVNKIEKIAEGKYLIPKDFTFFELGLEGEEKVAVDTSNRVIRDGITGHFTFQGPVFEKYAALGHEVYNVKEEDAFVTAVHCGACADDVIKMAHLKRDTPLYFEDSRLHCPMAFDEFVEKLAEVSERDKVDLAIINDNLTPILKIAARLEEEFVVDKVLSLGAVNDRSIKEFIQYIPALEETASYLARLLMMTRLGQHGVPEKDIEEAMEALSRVILHLKNLGQSVKNSKELTV